MTRTHALSAAVASWLLACLVACASAPPPRWVVERDVGDLAYRRYQKVLDVELAVPGNEAVGHTATYVARHGEDVRFATAFVSVYERAASLAAEVKERLDSLGSYQIEVARVSGEWVFRITDGDETWLLWVSENRVVKLGAPPGEPVPEALADLYLGLYPSDLDESGRARRGTASAGASATAAQDAAEDDEGIPTHLREGAPR